MKILVSGGCGYLGSHQVVSLLQAGHQVVVVDNLANANSRVIRRIEEVVGTTPTFIVANILDSKHIERILSRYEIEAIIHFAGYKHVRESMTKPTEYYHNNIGGLVSLITAAQNTGIRKLVFSSSGSVYGETNQVPIEETRPLNPSNPYSTTKVVCEQILHDVCAVDDSWSVASLRYFNPAGAHSSGRLGDATPAEASNLLPVLMEAAAGRRSAVDIYGTDFETPDGSGVRDYIHVEDVAETHLRAIDFLNQSTGHVVVNVGRGKGTSVLQMVKVVEEITGRKLETRIHPRRPGDVSALFGETSKAQKLFGDMDYRDLSEIVASAWKWEEANPKGYGL